MSNTGYRFLTRTALGLSTPPRRVRHVDLFDLGFLQPNRETVAVPFTRAALRQRKVNARLRPRASRG
jgi:hypothetical protein